MKQTGTIFRFEFKNYAKSKSFLILTILLVIAIGIGLNIPRIQESIGTTGKQAPSETKAVAVVDKTGTGQIATVLSAAMKDKKFQAVDADLNTLKSDVDSDKYSAAVYAESPLHYRYVVKNIGMYDTSEKQIDAALLSLYRIQAMQKSGISPADAQKLLSAQVTADVVQTAQGKDQEKNFFYTYVVIFVLYMAILIYGQLVASSVASEKSTRAMELLITSAKPKSLMFGKVFGAGTAGLLQLAVILGSGYIFYHFNQDYLKNNEIVKSIFDMPLSILLYALLFFLLGYFIYAFLYGALGSLVSRMEELNQAIMPVSFLFIISFLIVIFSMTSGNVDNVAMIVCSYIPLTSPMAMFVRIAMGNVAPWEIILSVAILVGSTIGIGFLASAIYRIGVLLYGKAPKPKEIAAMLRNR
jgi:ABC-2 type transport system permease protein